MGSRQKSAKDKVKWLARGGIVNPTLADVTNYLTKKGRKK